MEKQQTTQLQGIKKEIIIYHQFSEQINSNLIVSGNSEITKLAPIMFLESPKAKDLKGDVVKMLMDYSEIYFGIKIENIPVLLFKHSIDFIIEAFDDITIQDVENSFKYSKIEKKQYTALTVDELIDPIFKYFEKKKILLNEIEKIKRLESEKIDQIRKEKQFKQHSRNVPWE